MRIKSTLCLLLLTLSVASVHAQRVLPLSVQQFLNEQHYSKQYRQFISTTDADFYQFVSPRIEDGIEVVDAFIAYEEEHIIDRLKQAGVIINCVFEGFVTAQIPTDRLQEVSTMAGVTDVEISRRLKLCTDSTMHVTHVDHLLSGTSYGLPANYDGSGVLIGVIDVGFDFQHRAFRSNSDPSITRIARVYNTNDKSGHKAMYDAHSLLPGSVFMNNEIYSLTTDKTNNTHGTHTASIAAGSHVNGYGGMAPGADIVLCAISIVEGDVSAVEIANCVRYIDSYADSVGKPCVMSLSVSTANGQHDGLDYLSKVIKQITGPGRIMVIAAGNNSGRKPYSHHLASAESPLNLMFKCKNTLGGDSTYYYGSVNADVWMRSSNANFYYKFHILDQTTGTIVWETGQLSNNTKIYASQLQGYFDRYASADTASYISAGASYASQGKKYRLNIELHNLISQEYTVVNGEKKSRYALGVTVYPRKATPCEIDAWMCNSMSRFGTYNGSITDMNGTTWNNFYSASSDSCCIGTYAVCDSTISVGAYSARNSYYSLTQNKVVIDNSYTIGDIASFSGFQIEGAGPTGKALPTICAPGTCVVAAASRYSYLANSNTTVYGNGGSYWGVLSGTSMSAPTVAGIIALWLQANPNLSVADIKDILAETAVKDQFTLNKADQFGPNGKIDALAGMRLVLEKMKKTLLGDVNGDERVNIEDVTTLISYLLTKNSDIIDFQAADMDESGNVDIYDLTVLVGYILRH